MSTLLLRLMGPMQSWGTTSRFDQRDTGKEPSKSGVIGLLAAAMGIDRADWEKLEPLIQLKMGVRHDRPGVLRKDYQTAGCSDSDTIIKADGSPSKDGVVSERYYLADAAFLVGLEGDDRKILEQAHNKLRNPQWVLGLGRKSYLPAEPVYLKDGLCDVSLKEALFSYPWLGRGTAPQTILYSFESPDGSGRMVMDQSLSSFAERRFGSRFVVSEWLPITTEVAYVPA
ncbi:MAG: type I-E CRISPR-associated protein Cas5/CasD [Candidatus Aureabacteria bacterium]|nr:type I-E CRISPR-associated protein Cas5/CasD [Candidatus Auribacterota bacterium]